MLCRQPIACAHAGTGLSPTNLVTAQLWKQPGEPEVVNARDFVAAARILDLITVFIAELLGIKVIIDVGQAAVASSLSLPDSDIAKSAQMSRAKD